MEPTYRCYAPAVVVDNSTGSIRFLFLAEGDIFRLGTQIIQLLVCIVEYKSFYSNRAS